MHNLFVSSMAMTVLALNCIYDAEISIKSFQIKDTIPKDCVFKHLSLILKLSNLVFSRSLFTTSCRNANKVTHNKLKLVHNPNLMNS